MLGEQILEERGKVTNVKILSVEGGTPKMEVSVQSEGEIKGIPYSGAVTYWSIVEPSGTLYGEANGMLTTKDGDLLTFRAQGAGKSTGAGAAAQWRGAVYYQTSAEKFASLNGIAVVFEYESDDEGNSAAKGWEWK